MLRSLRVKRPYLLIGVLFITLFWLIMMGQLLEKEAFFKGESSALPPGSAEALKKTLQEREETWMGIYYYSDKVGYSHTRLEPLSQGDLWAFNQTFLALNLQGKSVPLLLSGWLTMDENLFLKEFSFSMKSGLHLFKVQGERQGEGIKVVITTEGQTIEKVLPCPEGTNLANIVSPLLFMPDMREGNSFSMEIMDPFTLTLQKAIIKVENKESIMINGEEIKALKIVTEYQGMTFLSWMNEDGELVKEETPLGFWMQKESQETASAFHGGKPPEIDFLVSNSVPSDRILPNPERINYMKIRISGIDTNDFEALPHKREGIVEIESAEVKEADAPSLPILYEGLKQYLEPSLFIQSQNEEVRGRALDVVGREKNSWRAAMKIYDWVYASVAKEPTISVPSAIDVLHHLKGDCNEHTVLYTALARAVGLPSKMAVGLVYSDGAFYYHAWPEVYVGRWVALDPTLGQRVADATHIKLLEGEMEEQIKLLKVIGKMSLEVIEYR